MANSIEILAEQFFEPSPPRTAKDDVLEALDEFRLALLEARTVTNQIANGRGGPAEAGQVEKCLAMMAGAVEQLQKTVQTDSPAAAAWCLSKR